MNPTAITIGTLAQRSSVGVETIRFYEKQGLLPKPARTLSGYRSYSEETVERVRFIRRAKDLGFTLEEVSELLALKVSHGKSCASVRQRALDKVESIDRKMRELRKMRKALDALVQRCSGQEGIDDCTILDALTHGAEPPPQPKTSPKKRGAS